MSDPAECEILGRWRIVAADQWDREYLDLVEPAFIRFDRDSLGELVFGVVTAGLDLAYARTVVFFTFEGTDEGDEVSGSGSAELTQDGARNRTLVSQRRRRCPQSETRVSSSTAC